MGIRFLLLIVALIGLMYFASWLKQATPSQRSYALRNIAIYGIAGALLILVATGRIHWLFALIGAAAPWLQRAMLAMRAWNSFKAFAGPAAGRQSSVNTAWLAMTLDHDSGDIDGQVLAGKYQGTLLSALSVEQLLDLLQECGTSDPRSVPLIEAFLDRHHGTEWRGGEQQSQSQPAGTQMTEEEALAILGLEQGAHKKDIQAAHRSLMQKMHPDRGGSAYLATRINLARDILLGKD